MFESERREKITKVGYVRLPVSQPLYVLIVVHLRKVRLCAYRTIRLNQVITVSYKRIALIQLLT